MTQTIKAPLRRNNLNSLKFIKEIEFVVKSLPINIFPGPDAFTFTKYLIFNI